MTVQDPSFDPSGPVARAPTGPTQGTDAPPAKRSWLQRAYERVNEVVLGEAARR